MEQEKIEVTEEVKEIKETKMRDEESKRVSVHVRKM